VHQIDPSHKLEKLSSNMRQTSDATRSHIDFARISPGIGDEVGNGLRGEGWGDGQYGRRSRDTRNWSNVTNKVEIERVVERCVPHVGGLASSSV